MSQRFDSLPAAPPESAIAHSSFSAHAQNFSVLQLATAFQRIGPKGSHRLRSVERIMVIWKNVTPYWRSSSAQVPPACRRCLGDAVSTHRVRRIEQLIQQRLNLLPYL